MPRVTYETYCQRHLQLYQLWKENQGVFAAVDPMEQWDLHEYFLCADQPTEATLRSHYADIKQAGSSLPQRAGRAYAALMRNAGVGIPVTQQIQPSAAGRKQRVLTVRSLVKPKIDMDLFVDTAVQMCERLAKDSRAE